MQSRKHYAQSASTFKTALQSADMFARQALIALAKQTADNFARDNPRFNRKRYLTACGILVEEDNKRVQRVARASRT